MGGRAGGGARGGGGGLNAARAEFQAARAQYVSTNAALAAANRKQWDEATLGKVSPETTKAVLAAQKAHDASRARRKAAQAAVEKLVGHKLKWDMNKGDYV